MEKMFFSRSEFAKNVGISMATLNRGVRDNVWPFSENVLIGRRRLFPASLLTEIVNRAGKSQSTRESNATGGSL
jgi:hypothetical protein